MNDIILTEITKNYGGAVALPPFSAVFPGGKVSAVMGRSGSGKTTLLRIIAGLDVPSSGKLDMPDGKVAVVFQDDLLIGTFTPEKNIAYAVGKSAAMGEIRDHLIELGLGGDAGKKCDALSGGMRRRVAIARAVLAKPDILLLDEPFKGLDEATRAITIAYVLRHTAGKTVILVTHDKDEACKMGVADDDIVNM